MSVRANFADIYLRGMRDRSTWSGTELAREIQLTDWSTAAQQGKLVFVIPTTPSLAQFISLFTTGRNRLSIVQITHQSKFFTLRFLSRKNVEKKFVLTNKIFFRNFDPIRCLRVARKPVQPVLWSTNTAWYLYSFWALFVLFEVHWIMFGYETNPETSRSTSFSKQLTRIIILMSIPQ